MSNTIDREGFIFYRSFYEAINDLPEQEQFTLYKAIADFSFTLQEPKLEGVCSTIFKLIKPQVEANNRKYINGKKGAKKKQKESKKEAKGKQKESNSKAKEKEKEKDKKNINKKKKSNVFLFEFLKQQGLPEKYHGSKNITQWMPDKFEQIYKEKRNDDKMWVLWDRFCSYYTSDNAKRKKYIDWQAVWINWNLR